MIGVVVVDDDTLVREGLKLILSADSEIEIVADAENGAEAVDAVRQHRPDVVLMDIRMPKVDGITATERLRSLPNPPQVIVLTTFHLDDYVFGALAAGASGFLLKDTPPTEIPRAVRLVAEGEAMLSPAVTKTLIQRFGHDTANAKRASALEALETLSDREREVALVIAGGLSNAEIARKLFMSEATVKTHVSRLFAKLDLTNRVQIAILVHNAGAL